MKSIILSPVAATMVLLAATTSALAADGDEGEAQAYKQEVGKTSPTAPTKATTKSEWQLKGG